MVLKTLFKVEQVAPGGGPRFVTLDGVLRIVHHPPSIELRAPSRALFTVRPMGAALHISLILVRPCLGNGGACCLVVRAFSLCAIYDYPETYIKSLSVPSSSDPLPLCLRVATVKPVMSILLLNYFFFHHLRVLC